MEEKQNTSPIELRSEKVRRIIGDIPHGLVYWELQSLLSYLRY